MAMSTALATTFDPTRPPAAGLPWRIAVAVADLVKAMGVVLLVPFVILAIGMPVVLGLRLLLWIFGLS